MRRHGKGGEREVGSSKTRESKLEGTGDVTVTVTETDNRGGGEVGTDQRTE